MCLDLKLYQRRVVSEFLFLPTSLFGDNVASSKSSKVLRATIFSVGLRRLSGIRSSSILSTLFLQKKTQQRTRINSRNAAFSNIDAAVRDQSTPQLRHHPLLTTPQLKTHTPFHACADKHIFRYN